MKQRFVLVSFFCFLIGCNSIQSFTHFRNDSSDSTSQNTYAESNSDSAPTYWQEEHILWEGSAGKFRVSWSDTDLRIFDMNGTERGASWRKLVLQDFDKHKSGLSAGSTPCQYRREFQILSIVGSLVTFQDLESIVCAIHSDSLSIATFDLSRINEIPKLNAEAGDNGNISLKEIFSEEDIFNAFMASKEIRAFLGTRTTAAGPKDLRSLLTIFDQEFNGRGAGDYAISDQLDNFAFYRVEGEKTIVRIFLMPTSGYNAGAARYIDLAFYTPQELKKAIALANDRREGFLLSNRSLFTRGRTTLFSANS